MVEEQALCARLLNQLQQQARGGNQTSCSSDYSPHVLDGWVWNKAMTPGSRGANQTSCSSDYSPHVLGRWVWSKAITPGFGPAAGGQQLQLYWQLAPSAMQRQLGWWPALMQQEASSRGRPCSARVPGVPARQ